MSALRSRFLSRFQFHLRHPWRIVVAILLLVVVAIEAGRLITIQLTLDQAAREAERYAVTGQFDPAHCHDADHCDQNNRLPLDQHQALEDDARLQTIYAIVQQAAGALSADALKIVVCSNRAGYAYDPITALCRPRDDVGGPGDEMLINVGYDYPIGSVLGAGVGTVSLQSMHEAIVERYRTVRVQGLPPTVEPSGGRYFTRLSSRISLNPLSRHRLPIK